jgi:hypothetical protein
MGASVASGGFRFSQISVGGTWYWTISADNILGSTQQFYLKDIQTPFGKYTDGVDVPIPGDVVTAMAGSMAQFQQQLSPLLALVSGQQTVINITATQGDPASLIGTINFLNAGAFGSFMTTTATPSVPWLSTSPTTIPGIGQNQQGQYNLILDPTTLQTSPTPYTGVINLQDNRAVPTLIPIIVNVSVLPQPVIGVFPNCVGFTWTLLTASSSGSQPLTITNTGPATSILEFTIAKVQCNNWLELSPTSASGIVAGGSTVITLSLNSSCIPQIPGEYFETVLISSANAANSPVAIQVTLCVFGECDRDSTPPDTGYSPFGEPRQPGVCSPGEDWHPGGNYGGGPGPPFDNGPGNQPTPGSGWADPPAPGPYAPSPSPPCPCGPPPCPYGPPHGPGPCPYGPPWPRR